MKGTKDIVFILFEITAHTIKNRVSNFLLSFRVMYLQR